MEAFEKKFSLKKSTKSTFGRDSKCDLETFFQKIVDFLQYNLIGVPCGLDFPMTERKKLSGPPRYLARVREAYRKFSRGSSKKFQLKTSGFVVF